VAERNVRGKVNMGKVSDTLKVSFEMRCRTGQFRVVVNILSCNVNLVYPRYLARFLPQELQSNILIEVLDLLMPILSIQGLMHELSLFGMEGQILSKHEV